MQCIVGENVFEGLFSTEHLLGKDLSHITFWTNDNTYHTTPEPGTSILTLIGLLAFTYTSRKE